MSPKPRLRLHQVLEAGLGEVLRWSWWCSWVDLRVLENGDKLQIVDASAAIQRHACKACGTQRRGR